MIQEDEKPPIFVVPGLNTNVGFINNGLTLDTNKDVASYCLHIDIDRKLLDDIFFIKSKSIADVFLQKQNSM